MKDNLLPRPDKAGAGVRGDVGRGWWDGSGAEPPPRPERGGRGAAARRRASWPRSPTAAACCGCSAGPAPARPPWPSRPWSRRVESGEATPDQCLMLTSSRVAAGSLRERVTARLGGTSTEPLARTHQALGFGILRAGRGPARRPDPATAQRARAGRHPARAARRARVPRAPVPRWPERVHLALGTRGFRGELRDLLMRAVEHDLEPDDLARLGPGARPARVGGRGRGAGASTTRSRRCPRPAPTTRPGSSVRRPTCSRRTRRARARLRRRAAPGRRRRRPGAHLGGGPAAAHHRRARARPRAARRPRQRGADLPRRRSPPPQRRMGAARLPRGGGPRSAGGEPRTLVLPTAYRLPQAVRRRGGQGGAQDRCAGRRRPARCGRRPSRGPRRRAAAARGRARRPATSPPSCARRTCATAIPWSRDGGHRAWPGAHGHAATGADGCRGAGRRHRHRPAGARRGGGASVAGPARGACSTRRPGRRRAAPAADRRRHAAVADRRCRRGRAAPAAARAAPARARERRRAAPATSCSPRRCSRRVPWSRSGPRRVPPAASPR